MVVERPPRLRLGRNGLLGIDTQSPLQSSGMPQACSRFHTQLEEPSSLPGFARVSPEPVRENPRIFFFWRLFPGR